MARSDLLLDLIRAGNQGDQLLFSKIVEAIAAEERAKQHHVLADQLTEQLQTQGRRLRRGPSQADDRMASLFYEVTPRRKLTDLVISDEVDMACRELVEEQHRVELLRSYNLEPRHRVLLVGPPGNGKTSLAEALAEALMVPLFVIRYEGVIGAYLGETAVRLRQLLDYVRTCRCVLFFDEFDTLGKERGDEHETGEVKRVVSSLLLQVDALPSHVVVVAATNHPELLDRAVWRRFELRLYLAKPNKEQLTQWFRRFQADVREPLGFSPEVLAQRLLGASFSDAEEFRNDVLRRYVLSLPNANMNLIVAERLRQWQGGRRTIAARE